MGEIYLREHRGITGPLPPEPRFDPNISIGKEEPSFPGLIVPAFAAGELCRVQAILLDPDTCAWLPNDTRSVSYTFLIPTSAFVPPNAPLQPVSAPKPNT
jgi:hypothetical protein